jgi:hypothetical protein
MGGAGMDDATARELVSQLSIEDRKYLHGLSSDDLLVEREYFVDDLKQFANIPEDQQWCLDGWRTMIAGIDRELRRRNPGRNALPPATITPDHVATIKATVSLAQELMDIGVTLRKNGAGQVGICPFHTEKTPSFHLYSDGRYHCFGCHAHGDIVTFTQQYRGLTFIEAVRYLALQAGVRLPLPARPMRPLTRADGFTL